MQEGEIHNWLIISADIDPVVWIARLFCNDKMHPQPVFLCPAVSVGRFDRLLVFRLSVVASRLIKIAQTWHFWCCDVRRRHSAVSVFVT